MGGKRFLVFHYLAGEDEAEIFNWGPRKLGRNRFLELENTQSMRAEKEGIHEPWP